MTSQPPNPPSAHHLEPERQAVIQFVRLMGTLAIAYALISIATALVSIVHNIVAIPTVRPVMIACGGFMLLSGLLLVLLKPIAIPLIRIAACVYLLGLAWIIYCGCQAITPRIAKFPILLRSLPGIIAFNAMPPVFLFFAAGLSEVRKAVSGAFN